MKRKSEQYQHEPLIAPAGWQEEERRFVIALTALLDTLFLKAGQMEGRIRELETWRKGEKASE